MKTVGIAGTIRDVLMPRADNIVAAYLFGSTARGTQVENSDDVWQFSTNSLGELVLPGYRAELKVGREINPVIYRKAESQKKTTECNNDARVMDEKRLLLWDLKMTLMNVKFGWLQFPRAHPGRFRTWRLSRRLRRGGKSPAASIGDWYRLQRAALDRSLLASDMRRQRRPASFSLIDRPNAVDGTCQSVETVSEISQEGITGAQEIRPDRSD